MACQQLQIETSFACRQYSVTRDKGAAFSTGHLVPCSTSTSLFKREPANRASPPRAGDGSDALYKEGMTVEKVFLVLDGEGTGRIPRTSRCGLKNEAASHRFAALTRSSFVSSSVGLLISPKRPTFRNRTIMSSSPK